MMRKALLLLSFLMAATSGSACGDKNSVLQVNLTPVEMTIGWLSSQTMVGGESRTIAISSPDLQPIYLGGGTSFTIEIEHKYEGEVWEVVAALDDNNTLLLTGSGYLPSLDVGTLNIIDIVWQ
jgi:hypothetical protein